MFLTHNSLLFYKICRKCTLTRNHIAEVFDATRLTRRTAVETVKNAQSVISAKTVTQKTSLMSATGSNGSVSILATEMRKNFPQMLLSGIFHANLRNL